MTEPRVTWAAWKRDAECGCTDPDPAACTSWCEPSPQYTRECPCHYLTNRAQDEAHAAADGPPDPSPAAPDAPTVADAQAMLRRMADAACSDTDGFCDVHGFHRHAPAPDGLRADKAERAVNLLADQYRALEQQLADARAETATADRIRADVQRDRDRLAATVEWVRRLAERWENAPLTDRSYARALRTTLNEPSDGAGADTARRCGSTLPHPGHTFMRLHVVFNCPGTTPKDPS